MGPCRWQAAAEPLAAGESYQHLVHAEVARQLSVLPHLELLG